MKKIFILFLSLIFSFGFFSKAISQEALTLSLTPPLIKININPSQNWSSSLKVVNNNPYDLQVFTSVMDFKSGPEGGMVFIQDKKGENKEKIFLSEWLEIERGPILIPAYQSKQIPFTIKVPQDAEPGGKYVAILVGTKAQEGEFVGSGIKVGTLVSSLILATIKGQINEEARIREFSTEKTFYQKPEVKFTLRVENLGNVHIQPQGEIKIFNFWGKERGKIAINQNTEYGNILPDSIKKWVFTWKGNDSLLEAGKYKAILNLVYGSEGKQALTNSVSFWVVPVVPLAGILGGIVFFFVLIFLIVRLYVKRMIKIAQREIKREIQPVALGKSMPSKVLDLRKITQPKEEKIKKPIFIKKSYKIIFLSLIIVSIVIFGVFYFNDVLKKEKKFEIIMEKEGKDLEITSEKAVEELKNNLKEKETIKESGTKEPVKEIDKLSFQIKILNGSGITGAAQKLNIKLSQDGFKVLGTANADNFNYEQTLIRYKKEKKREAEFLNQYFENKAKLEEIEGQKEDVIIIIGKDLALTF